VQVRWRVVTQALLIGWPLSRHRVLAEPAHPGGSLTAISETVKSQLVGCRLIEAASPRRIDAARNDERILTGAVTALGRDPSAGMTEIAAACGVSRATLFRRYPARDELIATLRNHAHSLLAEAVAGAEPDSGRAAEAIARLCDELLRVGEQFAFLEQNPNLPGRHDGITHIAAPVEALIARGQLSGEFDAELPPRWCTEMIVSILPLATREAKRSSHRRAVELMTTTVLRALRS
jgi:AcrR family transcriptional regulator